MQITLETDYAVRILCCLCEEAPFGGETRLDAKTIAEKTGVTLRFSLKILRKLVGEGIVRSFKGTQGGYRLNRDPAEVTLLHVVEAIEGRLAINRCMNEGYTCTMGSPAAPCRIRHAFEDITDQTRKALDSYTFADLCQPCDGSGHCGREEAQK